MSRIVNLTAALVALLSVGCNGTAQNVVENSALASSSANFDKHHEHLYAFGGMGTAIYDTSDLAATPQLLQCQGCFLGAAASRAIVMAREQQAFIFRKPLQESPAIVDLPSIAYELAADRANYVYAAVRGIGIVIVTYKAKNRPTSFKVSKFGEEVGSIAASNDRVAVSLPGRVEIFTSGLLRHVATIREPSPGLIRLAYDIFGRLYVLSVERSTLVVYRKHSIQLYLKLTQGISGATGLYVDDMGAVYIYSDRQPCEDGRGLVRVISLETKSIVREIGGLRDVLAVAVGRDGAVYVSEQGCGFNASPWIDVFKSGSDAPSYRLTGVGLSNTILIAN